MKKLLYVLLIGITFSACNSQTNENQEKQEISAENLVQDTLNVNGMTCTGCENGIQEKISAMEGISSVKASHLDSIVIVAFDKSIQNIENIKSEIDKNGYQVVDK